MRPQPHTKSIGIEENRKQERWCSPGKRTPVDCQCTASSKTIHTSNIIGLNRFILSRNMSMNINTQCVFSENRGREPEGEQGGFWEVGRKGKGEM